MNERNEVRTMYAETVPYLLHWYEFNRRILPWREDPTPYHVWVSEIMLQQTRVEAVKGYYDRFLTCLPDVRALAEAKEDELLKLWEGLGYYNRVRNMQKAARVLVEQYGGEMPADYESIRVLPGIGDYTAGAIASIAFGLPYPAVDGNVLRVMSRITGSEEDIAKESTKKKMKEDLTAIMPEQSGDFNQSLMELGATVCLPNGKPLCEQCPVMHLCKAFHAGRETELPVKSGKKERRIEKRIVYLVYCGEKVLLHRRPDKGLLAGLWEFPNVLEEQTWSVGGSGRRSSAERIAAYAAEALQVSEKESSGAGEKEKMPSIRKDKKAKHIFSHVEWHMEGIRIEAEQTEDMQECLAALAGRLTGGPEKGTSEAGQEMSADGENGVDYRENPDANWVFVTPEELRETYPVPSTFEVYVKEVLHENRNRI